MRASFLPRPGAVLTQLPHLDETARTCLHLAVSRARSDPQRSHHLRRILAALDPPRVAAARSRVDAVFASSVACEGCAPPVALALLEAAALALLAERSLPRSDRRTLAAMWGEGLLLASLHHENPAAFEVCSVLAAEDPLTPLTELTTLADHLCT